jgi:hypothetical protein
MSHVIFFRRAIGVVLLAALGCGDDGDTKNDGGEGGSSTVTTGTAVGSTTSATTSATSVATTATTGQGGGGGGGTGGAPPLPDMLELTGMAMGMSTDGVQTVTCVLSGQMTDLVLDGDDITGFFSGEQVRLVEEGQFAFAFEPFVGGPASVTREGGGDASLILFGDQPPDAKPYWLELEVLSAVEVAPNEFEGDFRCAPLDMPGNPPDFTTTVMGSFRLAPPP